jgi:hypothetical protein
MLRRVGAARPIPLGPVRDLLERSVHTRAFTLARWPMLRVPGADPAADSIERHLGACLGTDVRVGVLLGTPRVNQKPVLQVFDLGGRLLGFAKIGHNPLTAALVRREAQALATVGAHDARSFRAPRILHHGQWAGLEVLVISPLVTDPRRPVPHDLRLDAMREVAHLAGSTAQSLAGSPFWSRLRDEADRLPDHPDGDRVRAAMDDIERSHGGHPVLLGGWHGDWGHWNMGLVAGGLGLWDWERYDPQVPVGFDAVHFVAQRVRPGERHFPRQERAFLRSVPRALSELGVAPSGHDITLRLYLLEIAIRYVGSLEHGATAALRRRTSWVLSLQDRLAGSPEPSSSEGRP